MYDLKGKWVFVTGAGSGIGYETCIAFAKKGCHILATDIDLDRLDDIVASVRKLGVKGEGFPLDVSNEIQFRELADHIINTHGCPDILVSNAGILLMEDVKSHSRDMWQKTFEVNVLGVVYGTQLFLEAMQAKSEPAFIVNIASQASRTPYVYMSAYAASKYAVEGFTDALRTELAVKGSNVIPISVHPGIINTKIIPQKSSRFPEQSMQNLQKKYHTKGSHPSVVAADIVFAVQKGKPEIMSGSMAKIGYWLDKLLPKTWVARLVARESVRDGFILDL